MTKQGRVNDKQERTNEEQVILNDKTRFDLRFNNIYAIIVSVVTIVVLWFTTIGGIKNDISAMKSDLQLSSQKMDIVIANQLEQKNDFKQWKTQAETRLGVVESNQNTVISYVESHLQVKIR